MTDSSRPFFSCYAWLRDGLVKVPPGLFLVHRRALSYAFSPWMLLGYARMDLFKVTHQPFSKCNPAYLWLGLGNAYARKKTGHNLWRGCSATRSGVNSLGNSLLLFDIFIKLSLISYKNMRYYRGWYVTGQGSSLLRRSGGGV